MRKLGALSLSLLFGAVACGGEDPATEAGGGGGGGGAAVQGPSCTAELSACAAASPVGHWKHSKTCGDIKPLVQALIEQAAGDKLSCKDPIQIESVGHKATDMFLKIEAGEKYSRGGILKVTGEISVPKSCFSPSSVTLGCPLLSTQVPGSCNTVGDACVCQLALTQDFTDQGTVAVTGSTLEFTSDKGGTKSSASFCVQGAGLLLESSVKNVDVKLRDLWTK